MKKNSKRITFCPGPGAFLPEWIDGQTEFFGRGDPYYKNTKLKTIKWLKKNFRPTSSYTYSRIGNNGRYSSF